MEEDKKDRLNKKSEILNIAAIKENPLSYIILNKYTKENIFEVDRFYKELEDFVKEEKLEKKIEFIFGIYDIDGDGYISSTELFDLLRLLNKGMLNDYKIQNIVDQTFAKTGEYKTMISFEDFREILKYNTENLPKFFNCKKW